MDIYVRRVCGRECMSRTRLHAQTTASINFLVKLDFVDYIAIVNYQDDQADRPDRADPDGLDFNFVVRLLDNRLKYDYRLMPINLCVLLIIKADRKIIAKQKPMGPPSGQTKRLYKLQ